MLKTILSSVTLNAASLLARAILRLKGWRVVGDFADLQKAVIVGAPHTSGWDFFYSMLTALSLKFRLRWVGKKSHFSGIKAAPARWLGGVPVDRSIRQQAVEQIAAQFKEHEHFMLAISPEGTRGKVGHWKTGFYYIALRAEVPICIARMDYRSKEVVISDPIYPSGDIHADFELIREFYSGAVGRHPERFGEIRLAQDDEDAAAHPSAVP